MSFFILYGIGIILLCIGAGLSGYVASIHRAKQYLFGFTAYDLLWTLPYCGSLFMSYARYEL